MKKFFYSAIALIGLGSMTTMAQAGGSFGFSIGYSSPGVASYSEYYAPVVAAPVVVYPPAAYYYDPPVYYYPAPVYYSPVYRSYRPAYYYRSAYASPYYYGPTTSFSFSYYDRDRYRGYDRHDYGHNRGNSWNDRNNHGHNDRYDRNDRYNNSRNDRYDNNRNDRNRSNFQNNRYDRDRNSAPAIVRSIDRGNDDRNRIERSQRSRPNFDQSRSSQRFEASSASRRQELSRPRSSDNARSGVIRKSPDVPQRSYDRSNNNRGGDRSVQMRSGGSFSRGGEGRQSSGGRSESSGRGSSGRRN